MSKRSTPRRRTKPKSKRPPKSKAAAVKINDLLAGAPFGPLLFHSHLAAYVRDRCPETSEQLPSVRVHLSSGETLDLCHVISLAPRWVALAVIDEFAEGPHHSMRTELVPYEMLARITIRARPRSEAPIGFHQPFVPALQELPAQTLAAASGLRTLAPAAAAPARPPRKRR